MPISTRFCFNRWACLRLLIQLRQGSAFNVKLVHAYFCKVLLLIWSRVQPAPHRDARSDADDGVLVAVRAREHARLGRLNAHVNQARPGGHGRREG